MQAREASPRTRLRGSGGTTGDKRGLKSWVFRLISQCQLRALALPSPVPGPPAPGFFMAIPAELGLHAGLPFDELAYGDELRGP